tara:strand:+ start:117 stop:392 length:276 start_codon:yes stop_codon:yes gene_type:complete
LKPFPNTFKIPPKFPPTLLNSASNIKVFFKIMNKKFLIQLATPASISLLAISIFSVPKTLNADVCNKSSYVGENRRNPVFVEITNPYSIGQ